MPAAAHPAQIAAVAVGHPDAARVAECDLRLRDGRIAQEQRFVRLRSCNSRGAKEEQHQRRAQVEKPPRVRRKVQICLLVVHGLSPGAAGTLASQWNLPARQSLTKLVR